MIGEKELLLLAGIVIGLLICGVVLLLISLVAGDTVLAIGLLMLLVSYILMFVFNRLHEMEKNAN